MTQMKRWRGLKALVQDAVQAGSHAIERVQKDTTSRWLGALEAIEPMAASARLVHVIHDTTVSGVHGAIRLTTRVVGAAADAVLDALDDQDGGGA